MNREYFMNPRRGFLSLARIPALAALVAAAAGLGACTPTASDLAYPDLSQAPARSVPAKLMTQEEKDAAIAELRAEGAVNRTTQ